MRSRQLLGLLASWAVATASSTLIGLLYAAYFISTSRPGGLPLDGRDIFCVIAIVFIVFGIVSAIISGVGASVVAVLILFRGLLIDGVSAAHIRRAGGRIGAASATVVASIQIASGHLPLGVWSCLEIVAEVVGGLAAGQMLWWVVNRRAA